MSLISSIEYKLYNEGNLGSRTLTCPFLIYLQRDASKCIRLHFLPHSTIFTSLGKDVTWFGESKGTETNAWLLKQALRPTSKMVYRRYSKLKSWNQTCLPIGWALTSTESLKLNGQCLNKSIKITFPVNSVLGSETTDHKLMQPQYPFHWWLSEKVMDTFFFRALILNFWQATKFQS